MKIIQNFGLLIGFLFVTLTAACSSIKTLETWQDETYDQSLKTVLVMAVVKEDFLRQQFEEVLSQQLKSKGIDAIPSHTVLPQLGEEISREAVLEKVTKLGIKNVLVARSVMKEAIKDAAGVFLSPSSVYGDDLFSYYAGSMVFPEKEEGADLFTIATTLYDVDSEKPVWSDLSQVKVRGSRQAAINSFIPRLLLQLQEQKLID